jgi:hypothetical protein
VIAVVIARAASSHARVSAHSRGAAPDRSRSASAASVSSSAAAAAAAARATRRPSFVRVGFTSSSSSTRGGEEGSSASASESSSERTSCSGGFLNDVRHVVASAAANHFERRSGDRGWLARARGPFYTSERRGGVERRQLALEGVEGGD